MKNQDQPECRSGREIYVVSDLHIGNGSAKDSFLKAGREDLFYRLLDEIECQQGQLILLGDFLELWRYRLEDVICRWHRLLDRLMAMDVVYVLAIMMPC